MDESNFQVPSIPVLHVPTLLVDANDDTSADATNEDRKYSPRVTDTRIVKSVPLPKLCASCSVILLQYLKPLQMYLNQMINLTTGLSSGVDLDVLTELKKNLMDTMPTAAAAAVSASTPTDSANNNNNDTNDQTIQERGSSSSTDSFNTTGHGGHGSHDHSRSKREASHGHSGAHNAPHGEHSPHHNQQHHQRGGSGRHTPHSGGDQGDRKSNLNEQHAGDKSYDASSETRGHSDSGTHQVHQHDGSHHQQHHHQHHQEHRGHQDGHGSHTPSDSSGGHRKALKARGDGSSTRGDTFTGESKNTSRHSVVNTHGHSSAGKQHGDVAGEHRSYEERHDNRDSDDKERQGHGMQVHRSTDTSGTHGATVQGNSSTAAPIATWSVQHKDFTVSSDKDTYVKVATYDSPYAFVTIIYDDLSAINAIILANSMILSSKKQLKEDQYIYSLPFVAVISGHINSLLLDYLPNVFDEVLSTRHDIKLSLLSDASFGVTQLKLQLWKCLSRYRKCFFIESTSLIVGEIDDVFTSFNELSACVDWRFPDSFACSVFLLEPNERTYHEMTKFASQLLAESDDPELTSVDEMTILNQFFANKWNKMSFIYNFSQNSLIYTQQPAFMKFGGSVKIVNFSFSPISAPMNSEFTPEAQPWHVQFNLNQCTMSGEIHLNTSVNNYIKFYLSIFIKRVWPLLRHSLTPKLQARGKQDWSIYEIVSLLRTPSSMFENVFDSYSPITLRRIDPSIHLSKSNSIASASVTGSIVDTDEVDDNADTASVATIVNADDDEERDKLLPESVTDDDVDDSVTNDSLSESLDRSETLSTDEKETQRNIIHDPRSEMRAWESGRVDWMGAHRSDRIIDMLCDKINTNN